MTCTSVSPRTVGGDGEGDGDGGMNFNTSCSLESQTGRGGLCCADKTGEFFMTGAVRGLLW